MKELVSSSFRLPSIPFEWKRPRLARPVGKKLKFQGEAIQNLIVSPHP